MSAPSPEPPEIQVRTHGAISPSEVMHARAAITAAIAHAPRPVISAACALSAAGDRARQRPFEARATLDCSGRPVHAHIAAEDMDLAIDRLQERLQRRLADLGNRHTAERRHGARLGSASWHHGDLPSHRPAYFPRPIAERRVIPRGTYPISVSDPDEAAWEIHMLDEQFHLFADAASGDDALLVRQPDGIWELHQPRQDPNAETRAGISLRVSQAPVPQLAVPDARGILDATDAPFVFYLDADDGRGRVIYRRYDGHYGLVGPLGAARPG